MTSEPWGKPVEMDAKAFLLWLELASTEDVEKFGSTPAPDRYLSTSVLTSNINASMERVKEIMQRPSHVSRWASAD